jgi:hypothetical protein
MVPQRLRVVLLLPLLSAFIFVGSAFAAAGESIGEITSFYGDVNVLHQGEPDWAAAKLGLEIFQYDTVKTEVKSKVRITFEDGSLLNLSENTTMEIKEHVYTPEEERRTSLFSLTKGKVRAFCQRFTGEGSRFHVETPTAVIGIRGTKFIIWVVSNELTTVICLEDEVFVRNVDEKVPGEIVLRENQMTQIGPGVPPIAPTIAPEELRHQLEIDTAAFKTPPSSAHPEVTKEEAAVAGALEEATEVAEAAPPAALDLIEAAEDKVPALQPIPQDPAAEPAFREPGLPEPPPLPQPPPHQH